MIRHFYYNNQIKKYIVGFANIFAGLRVQTGKDACGEVSLVEVPISYGSKDRVVAAIGASNTNNKPFTLPSMACYMTGMSINPDRLVGVNTTDRRTYIEQGGVFPTDIKAVKRVRAIPYDMEMELSFYASNTDQMNQMLEQILMLFDYDLQLQINDAPFDWAKILRLELTGMSNEENYPSGLDKRAIIWTLTFRYEIWLSPPAEIRQEIINSITVRIGDIDNLTLNEFDDDGNLVPFSEGFTTTVITIETAEPSEPGNDVMPTGQPPTGYSTLERVLPTSPPAA